MKILSKECDLQRILKKRRKNDKFVHNLLKILLLPFSCKILLTES